MPRSKFTVKEKEYHPQNGATVPLVPIMPTISLPFYLERMLWHLGHLSVAYALALPIGWNREREAHAAGVRTFPIVSVASAALIMVAKDIPGASPETLSRVLQGLVTGIGFVGGGAILKGPTGISGTATAASIWCMAITGAAVGLKMYDVAVVLSILNFVTLRYMRALKQPPSVSLEK